MPRKALYLLAVLLLLALGRASLAYEDGVYSSPMGSPHAPLSVCPGVCRTYGLFWNYTWDASHNLTCGCTHQPPPCIVACETQRSFCLELGVDLVCVKPEWQDRRRTECGRRCAATTLIPR